MTDSIRAVTFIDPSYRQTWWIKTKKTCTIWRNDGITAENDVIHSRLFLSRSNMSQLGRFCDKLTVFHDHFNVMMMSNDKLKLKKVV